MRFPAILPSAYFHVVFTLPAELRPFALRNRRALFDLLFAAAARTLLTLGADPRRLGGLLGLTAVLHTWTRDLCFHPHLHVIVTGGGLTPDGQWVKARAGYLFPVKVLGRLFRGAFLAGLRRLFDKGQLRHVDPESFPLLIDKLYRKEWRPYAKRPFAGPEQVYQYLGYYTHRTGIANHRLLDIDDKTVTFKTRNGKTATLQGGEFIRRFLLHVLPRGFVKIRHYGLLAARAEAKRRAVRQVIEPASPTASSPEKPDEAAFIAPLLLHAITCPRCEKPALARRPLPGRSPPNPAREGDPR